MSRYYCFEGPFDSSYSLALINREMARALETLQPNSVALFSTEGPGDYDPNQNYLQSDPQILALWHRSQAVEFNPPSVTLRNLYPPRVTGMCGNIHLMNNYAWEESVFPATDVQAFNQHLQGVAVTSTFVRKVLIDSGVTRPIVVTGNGVDHVLRYSPEPLELPDQTAFCFLHISSCFPRKGIDVLLEAYTRTFSCNDPVVLLIKTFPNPHNSVEQQVAKYQAQDKRCPAIHIINSELTTGQMNSLYTRADALVAPSRGEGFGMPLAEAMLWDVPVITTGYGGQADFCTPKTAWLLNYEFAHSQSHLQQQHSLWVEPDVIHLMSIMRRLYEDSLTEKGRSQIKARTDTAKAHVLANYTWHLVATRLLNFIDTLPNSQTPSTSAFMSSRIAWITTWNSRCGIATYSAFLLQHLNLPVDILANDDADLEVADGENVKRCWKTLASPDHQCSIARLATAVQQGQYTKLVIQFNYAFFDLTFLKQWLLSLQLLGKHVYIFFHATRDVVNGEHIHKSISVLGEILKGCRRLFVHTIEDVNRLKRFGIIENVTLIPHGVIYQPSLINHSRVKAKIFRIASYGFLLPDKGIPELIRAVALVNQRLKFLSAVGKTYESVQLHLYNALYPIDSSIKELENCQSLIHELGCADNIILQASYQTDEQTLEALNACDLIVFPYQHSRESSSGAVRMGLASGKPVACTPLAVFNDVHDCVHILSGTNTDAIAEDLMTLIQKPELLLSNQIKQRAWVRAHAWEVIANRVASILKAD